jgi:hypothetical protein
VEWSIYLSTCGNEKGLDRIQHLILGSAALVELEDAYRLDSIGIGNLDGGSSSAYVKIRHRRWVDVLDGNLDGTFWMTMLLHKANGEVDESEAHRWFA